MSMLDGLLGQLPGNIDITNLAAKVGLSPEQLEQALAALGQAHAGPGDTVAAAAANTNIPAELLQQIVDHIGGEGALGHFATLLNEQGGVGAVLGKLGSLFGKS